MYDRLPQLLMFLSVCPVSLQVYRLYSEGITQAIVTGGPHTARSSFVKYMRNVKKSVLRLVEVFVEKCEDDALLVQKFVPALMEPVLGDYAASVPDARWGSATEGVSTFGICEAAVCKASTYHLCGVTRGAGALFCGQFPNVRLRLVHVPAWLPCKRVRVTAPLEHKSWTHPCSWLVTDGVGVSDVRLQGV